MKEILIGSKNPGKIEEIKAIIPDIKFKSLLDFPDITDIEENGKSYWENALIKAKTIYEQTGLLTLSDDSGLEVEYLNNKPGVFSARYGGFYGNFGKKNQMLLNELNAISMEKRRARFVCVVCLYDKNKIKFTEGILEGYIATEPQGTMGFGFDPIFYLNEFGKTVAELSLNEKNNISHRSKAFSKIVRYL